MGQVRRVDVHRLLTEDSVDQRMQEILRVKADEFNEYARRSDLKDITPDAVDISDLTAAAEVASQAENERRIVEMERKRPRMEERGGSALDGSRHPNVRRSCVRSNYPPATERRIRSPVPERQMPSLQTQRKYNI
jgi:hypothetical protein